LQVFYRQEPLWPVLLLVGVTFSLCLLWSAVVPFDKGPDEAEHYRVAHFIYSTGRLPVFGREGDMYGYVVNPYEAFISYASLPGFNYILAALAMRLVPDGDSYALLYAARLVSALAVTLTVFLAYKTARLLFPANRLVWWGTPLILLSIPQVTFTGSYVNQDAYTMLVCSLVLYVLLRGWQAGWPLRQAALLGLALGLVLLGRLNGYVVVPLAAVVGAISLRGPLWSVIGRVVTVVATAAAVSGWWFVRSYLTTGDPLGIQANLAAWRELAPLRRAPRELGLSLWDVLSGETPWTVFRTFWGVFGQMQVFYLWPYYALLVLLCLVVVIGLAWGVFRWVIGAGYAITESHPAAVLLLGLFVLATLGLVFWQAWTTSFATQGRYLFPAVVPIALFLTLGVTQLPLGNTLRPLALGATIVCLSTLTLIGLASYTVPAYYL